ncbi:UNVERIFIED_CONTAM: hypothetical protein K2H54_062305 [Gekko kuhli]
MKYLPGPHQTAISSCEFIRSFVRKEVENHKNNGPPHERHGFIDYYLAHIKVEKTDSTSTFDEANLVQSVTDFFVAGTDAIAATLSWALLFMVAHPDIQEHTGAGGRAIALEAITEPEKALAKERLKAWGRILNHIIHPVFLGNLCCQEEPTATEILYRAKVQEELDNGLESFKVVCYADRKQLPYTRAVLNEVQRLSNVKLFGLLKLCTENVNILGTLIPKDTLVITDLCSVLLDPTKWETPEKFNPNHFLDSDGKFIVRDEFLPFAAGKCTDVFKTCPDLARDRSCVGKPFARTQLFIFFANLLKAFTFCLPEGAEKVNTEPVIGAIVYPQPYKICAKPR